MKDNSDDAIKKKEIEIIETKNILMIIAIIILLGAIYFNKNAIKEIIGEKTKHSDDFVQGAGIVLDVAALIVILISLYVAYEEYLLNETEELDLTGSTAKIIAWIVAIIPAAIFLYVTIKFPDEDAATGIEPLV